MPSGAIVKVQLLDDSTNNYEVKPTSTGNELLQSLMKDLDVLESDYFGVSFDDGNGKTFLDPLRPMNRQIKKLDNVTLQFSVKFFAPDPSQIEDEYTRYLFALQIKRDISTGILPCKENIASQLAAFIVQAEFGDWNAAECSIPSYLNDMQLFPNPSSQNLQQISEFHKALIGKSPAEADYDLLDSARHLEYYGIRLHPALDAQNTKIDLAVTHAGVSVFQGNSRKNTFNWSRLRKLSFKRRRFLVKLRADAIPKSENIGHVLVFLMKSRDECKNFWRLCIEHHAFFRLEVRPKIRQKPLILSRGSSFHYNGKTQKELLELVRNSNFRRSNFVRTTSRRKTHSSAPSPSYSVAVNKPKPDLNTTENSSKSNDLSSNEASISQQNASIASSTSMSRTHDEPQQSPGRNEVNGIVTEAEVVADEHQKNSMPEWQLQSKSLHSSATPIEGSDTKAGQSEVEDGYTAKEEGQGTEENVKPKVDLHSSGQQSPDENVSLQSESLSPSTAPSTINTSTQELKMVSVGDSQRHPADQAYYIAKEFLTTERSYIKDLEVIDKWFKAALEKSANSEGGHLLPENLANQLFNTTDSLLSIHKQFKLELESRLVSWENVSTSRGSTSGENQQYIDDVLQNQVQRVKKLFHLIENGEDLVRTIEQACSDDERFDQVCRDFELEKVCYIPITRFLLQPMQRVIHYSVLLNRLCLQYSSENADHDHESLRSSLEEIGQLQSALQPKLESAHNFQKLAQLRHDLIGVDNILLSDREFVREGSLYKLSRKGFQQRLFFLFSGCLLYTSKGVTSTNQFKVHGELPLDGMIIEINDSERAVPNCFSILSGSKNVVVAASTQEEMFKWVEDLQHYINLNKTSSYKSPLTPGDNSRPVSNQSMDQSDDSSSSRNSLDPIAASKQQNSQQRSNTTMHVCWHRNTSVSANDYIVSLQNQLCGYLLRKFKNSNGWQKLWVVFTNFCLFFYKSHQDEFPLASLPLLGYSATAPTPGDNIQKEFVFKLQFKTHVYFFRAESKYTYSRWLEVIRSATGSSKRVRLFSRLESAQ